MLEGHIGLPALQPVSCLSGFCADGEGHGRLVYKYIWSTGNCATWCSILVPSSCCSLVALNLLNLLQSPLLGGEGLRRLETHPRYLTPKQVYSTNAIREGNFIASIDLKDAYFRASIHCASWKFCSFACQRVTYQFKVPCFGLSTALQLFRKALQWF